MPLTNPTRRTGPRRSGIAVAALAAALTVGAAAGLGGPTGASDAPAAAVVSVPADAAPPTRTVVRTVYQVTPTPIPAPVVIVHRVVAGGGEGEGNEHEGGGDD